MPAVGEQKVENGYVFEYRAGDESSGGMPYWVSVGAAPATAGGAPVPLTVDPVAANTQTGDGIVRMPQGNPLVPVPSTDAPSGPATRGYTDLWTNQRQNLTNDEILARSITARRMGGLTNILGQGEQRGIGRLRQNLAQRGLMDSGSLGAGISSINRDTQSRLAEGSQAAMGNEADMLLGMHQAELGRQHSLTMLDKQASYQRDLARYQAELQAAMQPSGFEQFLSGLGGAVGTGLGMYAGGRLFPVPK